MSQVSSLHVTISVDILDVANLISIKISTHYPLHTVSALLCNSEHCTRSAGASSGVVSSTMFVISLIGDTHQHCWGVLKGLFLSHSASRKRWYFVPPCASGDWWPVWPGCGRWANFPIFTNYVTIAHQPRAAVRAAYARVTRDARHVSRWADNHARHNIFIFLLLDLEDSSCEEDDDLARLDVPEELDGLLVAEPLHAAPVHAEDLVTWHKTSAG